MPMSSTVSMGNSYEEELLNISASDMFAFANQLFPICRSITGDGVRETLSIIQAELQAEVSAARNGRWPAGLPDGLQCKIVEVLSGTQCFDWQVPQEWNISDAFIMTEQGERIVDFKKNNLHVVGYSIPVNAELTLEELEPHLFSLPDQPQAIPYVTSYYRPFWGFCLSHEQRSRLTRQKYKVVIDSSLKDGSLTYGEVIIPGHMEKEVLLSTYSCHPSMGNNETSGLTVTTFLAKWLARLPHRYYSYRIVFVPETIGSIVYLSKNLATLKEKVIAGFQVTCVGDDRAISFLPSRLGETLADKVAQHVLKHQAPECIYYSFLDRGSDERQYCSPGVDLPVVSIMRSKYGTYPEYHTSLDNMDFVSASGLNGAWHIYARCLYVLEHNRTYQVTCYGEPQLGKRGLYPTTSTKDTLNTVKNMMDLMAYCDGHHDLIDIAERLGVSAAVLIPIANKLHEEGLLRIV